MMSGTQHLMKLVTFPHGRPTILMLYLISTLMMQLKVGTTKVKKANDVGSSLGVSSL